MSIKTRLLAFLKGFYYAFRGIFSCVKSERNMRVHLCAAFYVLSFMHFYELSSTEKAVTYLTIGVVIAFEIVNTAVEACVDLISPKYHPLAKKAKDASAGAVLGVCFFAAVIGVCIYGDTAVFHKIYCYFYDHVFVFIGFLISVVLWLVFIFSADAVKEVKEKDNDNDKH
ncbi:MAG: diacylglycerol kinase family protein [Oscillospiraceae bacterium]